MLTPESNEIIERAFLDTLEQMAFMFGEAARESAAGDMVQDPLRAEMSFSGYRNGRIALVMPADVCRELAANLLGLESEEAQSDSHAHDALKELLNVVTSQILTHLAGDGVRFRLSIPSVAAMPSASADAFVNGDPAHHFQIEGRPALLCFSVEDQP